jgi:hypothetical protein
MVDTDNIDIPWSTVARQVCDKIEKCRDALENETDGQRLVFLQAQIKVYRDLLRLPLSLTAQNELR